MLKIFCDSANLKTLSIFKNSKKISGFTTNPTLIKKEKIDNYFTFCKTAAKLADPKPISFEVISDEQSEIIEQSIKISQISKNIYVKIPIVNSKGNSLLEVIRRLSFDNIKLNVTAVMTNKQVEGIYKNLNPQTNSIISIFAGRIFDTGRNPNALIKYSIKKFSNNNKHKILWASSRQIYDLYLAKKINCDIITLTPDLIQKISLHNKNLNKFSQETSEMFYRDAKSSGLSI